MIRSIARSLMDYGASYNPEYMRLQCMSHILNLSIKAFWFGELGASGSQEQLDVIIVIDETMALWRKLGPWGKAHNITVYMRSSVQCKQQLKCLGAETLLQSGNATPWNSGLSIIQSLLRNKEPVNFFCLNNSDLAQDSLSESDCIELEWAVGILQPFLRSTLRLKSKTPNLWEVILEIDYLSGVYRYVLISISNFTFMKVDSISSVIPISICNYLANQANFIVRDVIAKYPHKAHLARAAHLGLSKLRCYSSMIRQILAYLAALVLNPRQKWITLS